jgi:proline iminopeptidase
MNIPQMESDTLEVATYLRTRFKREKIFVLGHSWGSILGLWPAHEHPDIIYSYVGVGQVINMEQNERVTYADALQQARDRHNEQALKELQSIAPYPSPNLDQEKMSMARGWEQQLLGPPPGTPEFIDTNRLLLDLVSAPEYSLSDDYAFIHGQLSSFSGNILLPEIMRVQLDKLGPDFSVPIFFFEGRHDPYARSSLVWDYSQTMKAPKKQFCLV